MVRMRGGEWTPAAARAHNTETPTRIRQELQPPPHTNSREWHTWCPREAKAAPTAVPCTSTSHLKISPPFFGSTTLFFRA